MATQGAVRSGGSARPGGERLFFLGMGIAILLLVFAGFAPSWFLRGIADPGGRPLAPLTPLIVAHGAAFSAWTLLFVVQAGLISARRPGLHRQLGAATVALGVVMVGLGVMTAIGQVGRGTVPPGLDPLVWLAVPLLDMATFSALLWLGYTRRRDPQAHKRLMLCATLLMLQPSIGRLPTIAQTPLGPEINVLVAWACSLALIAWDLASRGRVHWASGVGIGLLALDQVARVALWQTEGWRGFAGWLVGVLG